MANLNDLITRTVHAFDETWEDKVATLLLLYAASEGTRQADECADAIREQVKVLLATSMRTVAQEMAKALVLHSAHAHEARNTEERQLLERVWTACQTEVERQVRHFIGSTPEDP